MKPRYDAFFAYARERHAVYLRRAAGQPRPWTDDPVLSGGSRFTNVFRELDRTTVWFRENVRERYDGKPEVLLATVAFRMFNRIDTGEAMFCQESLTTMPPSTAFERFLASGDASHLKDDIVAFVGSTGPYTTGAYIISSPPGYSKLDGVLKILEWFYRREVWGMTWRGMAGACRVGPVHLETMFDWLREFPFLGSFHSYEIVTDLRHTYLLRSAPDVMRWCNVGPGAARGLARIHGRAISDGGKLRERVPTEQMLEEMRDLLCMSRENVFWPQPDTSSCGDGNFERRMQRETERNWPCWEMRDVEHTLCEWDKYERVRLGQGRTRGVHR